MKDVASPRGLVFFRRTLRIRACELPDKRRDNAAVAFEHDFAPRLATTTPQTLCA